MRSRSSRGRPKKLKTPLRVEVAIVALLRVPWKGMADVVVANCFAVWHGSCSVLQRQVGVGRLPGARFNLYLRRKAGLASALSHDGAVEVKSNAESTSARKTSKAAPDVMATYNWPPMYYVAQTLGCRNCQPTKSALEGLGKSTNIRKRASSRSPGKRAEAYRRSAVTSRSLW